MKKRKKGLQAAWSAIWGLVALAFVTAAPAQQSTSEQAKALLDAAGVQGGLIVHIDCNDGSLTAELPASESFMVHGLDSDPEDVEEARAHLHARGVYGGVCVDLFDGEHLPYVDNLVRLVIAGETSIVPREEILRVLCPGGVALLGEGPDAERIVKPWPAGIDEWTHALHNPSNNAVAQDEVSGPPRHLQWIGGPQWARSHDHLATVSAVVSSAGRVFSIVDEGAIAAVAAPAEWRLVARDAFSGIVLWKKEVAPWEGHLRGFRTGPAAIQRRLVAVGDTVYATLGYEKPVTALDAATGEVKHTCEGTDDALEIIVHDGVLYVVTGPLLSHGAALLEHGQGRLAAYESPGGKRLTAVDAETGELLWQKEDADTNRLMPMALAVADGKVYLQNTRDLICLDAQTGQEDWRADRPVATSRWAWTAPTLVVYDDVVLSADRDANSVAKQEDTGGEGNLWVVYSQGGQAPPGKLMAFDATTGERLWEAPAREVYNAPVDVLVVDGLVWTGELVRAKEPGITQGRDPRTGEVKRTRPPDSEFFNIGMGHHRCYRNKATSRFLVLGRSGVEWIDVKTGEGIADHWVRGACQYGVMPCNGLLYAPPHSCACYIEGKLSGFLALAPENPGTQRAVDFPEANQLERGPAYDAAVSSAGHNAADDWPTYRRDPARTGQTRSAAPENLETAWETVLRGQVTSPVAANGLVYVAQTHQHTVYALDADSGEVRWHRTVGGRVDSPPTIHDGLCLFGSRDGYVYCLRASDGELAWRFRAAPSPCRIVAYEQLESAWPVNGNVLVQNGSAYFAAGRCSYVDGGMFLYRLDAVTGEVQAKTRINNRDPETGREPQDPVRGVFMPGALPDVLSSDGENVFMRHRRFTLELEEREPDVPHLFCPAGFLDESWWHRTYWLYGSRMQTGWGGWGQAGYRAPAGRLMVLGDDYAYAFGRLNQYGTHGAHVGLSNELHPWGTYLEEPPHYVLFAAGKHPELVDAKARRRGFEKEVAPLWSRPSDLWARAMVLAPNALLVAGTPNPLEEELAAGTDLFRPGRPGALRLISPEDGTVMAEYPLSAPPAWDAMAVAGGRVFVVTTDGKVTCMKAGGA